MANGFRPRAITTQGTSPLNFTAGLRPPQVQGDVSGLFPGANSPNLFQTIDTAIQLRRKNERESQEDELNNLKFEREIAQQKFENDQSRKDLELKTIKSFFDITESGKDKTADTEKLLFDRIDKISDDIRSIPAIKDFSDIRRSSANINSAYLSAINPETKDRLAADQALITSFNKMLDPGSVVRESEYARTPDGQALISRFEGRIEQITAGGTALTDEAREEIRNMSVLLLENARQFAEEESDIFLKRADRFGIDRDLILGDVFKSKPSKSKKGSASSKLGESVSLLGVFDDLE